MTSSPQDINEATPGVLSEIIKTAFFALLIAFVVRTFLFQAFHIPSSSMEPNLTRGDYIITTKYSLGFGRFAADPLFELPVDKGRIFERLPRRGDVIVFKPVGSDIHYVKRLIGLPGDHVQMIDGLVHINKVALKATMVAQDNIKSLNVFIHEQTLKPVFYKEYVGKDAAFHVVQHNIQGNEADNTQEFIVPDGHYFYLGDNRDNSRDSRFAAHNGGAGYVPASHLVGRAEFVLLSAEDGFKVLKPWTWKFVRTNRFFKGL